MSPRSPRGDIFWPDPAPAHRVTPPSCYTGAWGDIVPTETTKETNMLFKKFNIQPIMSLRTEWREYHDTWFAGENYDPCFSVGPLFITYNGDPKSHRAAKCSIDILVSHDAVTTEHTVISVVFTQSPNGVKWAITREEGHKTKVLHSGTARDTDLLSGNPCPELLKERMTKVANAAIELAKVERTLMHI